MADLFARRRCDSKGEIRCRRSLSPLAAGLRLTPSERAAIEVDAAQLVEQVRARRTEHSVLDVFLQEFGLANEEGVALMCLAEALLRIPDAETVDALIADKILPRRWVDHIGNSESAFVNASTWALMLTGRVIALDVSSGAHRVTYWAA